MLNIQTFKNIGNEINGNEITVGVIFSVYRDEIAQFSSCFIITMTGVKYDELILLSKCFTLAEGFTNIALSSLIIQKRFVKMLKTVAVNQYFGKGVGVSNSVDERAVMGICINTYRENVFFTLFC